MSIFRTNSQPTLLHHALAWCMLIGLFGWALSQCTSSSPRTSTANGSTSSGGLSEIRLGSPSYRRDGFGTVLIASFAIYNDNNYPIKDVTVTCRHAAPSGTFIDSNLRTVYERIPAKGYVFIHDLNMGFILQQATRTACLPSDFSR